MSLIGNSQSCFSKINSIEKETDEGVCGKRFGLLVLFCLLIDVARVNCNQYASEV